MIKRSILDRIEADIDQLSKMADDPQIQRELQLIADEFADTESDGLMSDSQYQQFVAILDNLIDTVGEDENHPLASLMDVIGTLIERYEDENVPEITDL